MAERVIEIVIRGKNLTSGEFEKARREITGLGTSASAATSSIGNAFRMLGPAVAGIGFGSMAKQVLDYAGNINDLSAQTGLTTRAIQEMSHAAKMTGASLDNFTNAAFKLGTNLAGGGDSVESAVHRLGLSYESLKRMSPDEQFNTIATALGGVENAQERNRLAVELFGKAAKDILPAIAQGYDDLAKSASVAGDDQLNALDMAGDAWDSFIEGTMSAGVRIGGGLVITFQELGRVFESTTGIVDSLRRGFDSWDLALGAVGLSSMELPKIMNATQVAASGLPAPLKATANSMAEQDRAAKQLTEQVKASIETKKRAAAVEREFSPEVERLTASFKRQIEAYEKLKSSVSGPAIPDGFRLMRVELEGIGPLQTKSLQDTAAAQEAARKWAMENGAVLAPSIRNVGAALKDAGIQVKGLSASLRDGLSGVMQTIPGTLARAFEGGGNLMGAVKSIGSQIGSTIGGSVGLAFGGPMGAAAGQAIGSLVGPLIGKIGSLFTDKNKQQVQQYNGEIKKVQDSLLQQYGTMGDLEAAARRVGLSFAEAWGHQGKAGLDAFNQVAKEFKQRTEELNAKLAESSTKLGGLLTSSRDLGRSLPQALRDSINGLIELGLLTGDVVAQFKALGNESGVDFKKMQEAAQRYGVDLGALGPQFQSARLHASAVEIINDFDLLTAGGADVGGVLSGMKDEISALVRDSIQFGTTIPANMQPWVNELFRTGQLTDANGQKMTDISALKFSDPIKTQWEVITSSLQEVVMSLRDIASSIGQIPTNKTLTISTNYVDQGPPPGFGDVSQWAGSSGDEPGFSRGTFGMTGSDFPDFGAGQRVVLHHREAVVPYEDRVPFAQRVLGQASGLAAAAAIAVAAPNVYIVNDFTGARTVTESEFKQFQARLDGGGLQVPARAISARGR